MSYEGYDLLLCRNGHLYSIDSWSDTNHDEWRCFCGADCAWWTMVDETNGADPETGKCPGDVDLEIAEEPTFQRCSMGCSHMTTEARYRIPAPGIGHHREPTK